MLNIPTDAQLVWACRRGMLELDLLLSRFLQNRLTHLTEAERVQFARLLHYPDPDLYSWLMGQGLPDDPEIVQFVSTVRTYTYA